MAEVIKFSEEERNKTLATPEANQFLQDGVINPDSPEWQELPPEKQKEILEEMGAKLGSSKAALLQLKGELDAQDSQEEEDLAPEETKEEVPSSIKSAADVARGQVKSVFKTPNEQYISTFKQALGKIPGYEPATLQDISDALYQSQDFTLRFISWLEKEAASNSLKLDTSGDPGLWPFTIEKTEFASTEEKREYIKNMLDGLKKAFEGKEAGGGMIEGMLLWILAGGLTVGGVIAGAILVLKGGKWVLIKSLGAAGSAIVGVLEGVTGKTFSVGKSAAVKAGTAGVNAVRSHIHNRNGSAPAPTQTFQELDTTKPLEKAINDGILRNMYNQEVAAGLRPALANPNDPLPKDFVDEVKTGIDAAKHAEYQYRIMTYRNLGAAPVGNAKGMLEYNARVERAIRGDADPSKWNIKAKMTNKASIGADATALSVRLRQAHLDSQTETFRVGSDEFKIDPRAKAPLAEIQNLQEQIAEQEKKKAEFEVAKEKLEARLALEVEYGRIQARLTALPAEISAKKTDMELAKTVVGRYDASYLVPADKKDPTGRKILDTASRNADASYISDKSDYDTKKGLHDSLVAEQKKLVETDLPKLDERVRQITGKQLSDMTRMGTNNMKYTPTGKLQSSITLTQYQAPRTGVLAQISTTDGEIVRLQGEINTRLATLHSINANIPNAWKSGGIPVRMSDGSIEQVTKLSDLVAKIAKASVKK